MTEQQFDPAASIGTTPDESEASERKRDAAAYAEATADELAAKALQVLERPEKYGRPDAQASIAYSLLALRKDLRESER
jgi:hypothetical protein